ncbi:SpvB/TcaC N-terminal domain-containing protein [Erwinia sp. ErVv1]|uniref:SpvB/TcaC N-terminal domain-containing protein n=1 Tax=Erwinia sp. ErVv1 TaxID=1603299 RepID=UPI00082C43C6|nr:SpvB/TcaC N-terminal domain-containing protein [Erwinia sp. ErVv1]
MQSNEQLQLSPPSLPSGGGTINGLKGDMPAAGPDGAATLSIPLPVSAGRGYAPTIALSYHSRSGNSPFGMGWNLNLPGVQRRTRKGVPAWDETDEFTGPDGEVLVPLLSAAGVPETRRASRLLGVAPGGNFSVHTYRSRSESSFSRLERWRPDQASESDFWVLYSPNGEVLLLGRNAQARISHPENPAHTAVWLLESSVTLTGEQIYYQYRGEDDTGCDQMERAAHPASGAQRYLVAIRYGNKNPGRTLPALVTAPPDYAWLFAVTLDYGERAQGDYDIPSWQMPGMGSWSCRPDCFSDFAYGFDLRTRRLCRQVLLFHRLRTLAGAQEESEAPTLIARMQLNYDQTPSLSLLKTVRHLAYEPDGKSLSLAPPLEYEWQTFTSSSLTPFNWHRREDMASFNLLHPYQLIDLNGEGLCGILYQDQGAWWYRQPERQPGTDADAITWGAPRPLPQTPSLQRGGLLIDLNGDGQLEWVVTAPGVAGSYQRTPQGNWQHFTPLSALPVEYAHPRAQLTDIIGAGMTDLVLIGPRSVRLYSGNGKGWEKARTVWQAEDITLAVPDADARVLVAFSDLPGSGQQHLVEVQASGVRYWPNLGHGRFGHPIGLPGFSQPAETFNPNQLFLADTDGSGTGDLIYAHSDRLELYRNQSGNRFAEPLNIPLPQGVRFDRTCSLQVADIQGLGIASLILTLTHPVPQHWVCHLSSEKPWLLSQMDNHLGARHKLYYRSSAQFWLDEKAATGNPALPCYLPFALHTLWRTEVTDDITGNRLASKINYRHGVWDGQEREFRGFGFVEVTDSDTSTSQGTAAEIGIPAIGRSWYATGLPAVDNRLAEEFWQGDKAAWPGFTPRFTTGSGEDEQASRPQDETAFWLNRGLKGLLLRSELYGADGSSQAGIPYSVKENRPQVRLVEPAGRYPVVWSALAESRTYTYERVSSDPQCSQQVLLTSDEYGQPLREVNISYPRRSQPAQSPWPDTLPDTLFASSYDDQQKVLRLDLQQSRLHVVTSLAEGNWLLGIADATRTDHSIHSADVIPSDGLTLEGLRQAGGPIADSQPYVFGGQQQCWYLDSQNRATTNAPALPPRVAFMETAIMDEEIVSALKADITPAHLAEAGYLSAGYLFARRGESGKKLWTARQGYATYASAAHYWRPQTWRETLLTGAASFTWDPWDCVIVQQRDAAGLTTTAEYDWRFLTPMQVTDPNDNVRSVTLDALGRVTTVRFSGTENGQPAGYSDAPFTPPESAEAAFALQAPLPVAQCMIYVADSWKTGTQETAEILPPHVVTLTTDRYDNDAEQQIRQQVVFSDGFGRVLQAAARQANGEALQRTDDGVLAVDKKGAPIAAETRFRWAVTGRTEYDNKGQAIRTFQPWFLNDWKYVSDVSVRKDLYADTHYYDPPGREWQVKTAKGWLRRTLFTPWFVVSEDENDTAAEVTGNL